MIVDMAGGGWHREAPEGRHGNMLSPVRRPAGSKSAEHPMLALQRHAGNAGLGRALSAGGYARGGPAVPSAAGLTAVQRQAAPTADQCVEEAGPNQSTDPLMSGAEPVSSPAPPGSAAAGSAAAGAAVPGAPGRSA